MRLVTCLLKRATLRESLMSPPQIVWDWSMRATSGVRIQGLPGSITQCVPPGRDRGPRTYPSDQVSERHDVSAGALSVSSR